MSKKALIFGIVVTFLLSNCSGRYEEEAQGYVEGDYTYMATSVSGILKQRLVDKGYRVKKGQLLFVLEEQPESDVYAAAVENLNQAVSSRDAIVANLAYAKITYERNRILVPKGAIQQSALDNAKSNYDALIAQLAQANANIASLTATLAQAKWTKEQKRIYAPKDGIIFDTYFRYGEYTIANQPILALLAPEDIKAIFYVNEKRLGSLRLNDKIKVRCDGCEESYSARISFISPSAEYTPPVIYSTETNEKLVYRIEAMFSPNDAYNMHPGQPINVTYSLTRRDEHGN